MNRSFFIAPLALCIILTSGCAFLSGTPGDKPSSTSPKIVTSSAQKHQFWNDSSLFGSIPKNMQAEGDQSCSRDGNGKAIGYHPHPKKYDDTYFTGPGYLCLMN
ncbi:hypothetical protein ACL2XP_11390 [Sodalis sp. RH21]|uniref:hypothetical protein n=1 Tax=unclassified Sodalis (in: enterobacteria) TaxID=2636512 RepID=UPI0039B4A5DC